MSALICAMAACMVVELVAIKWDRYERTKQLDQLRFELKQLQKGVEELELKQRQKGVEQRKQQGGDKHLAPVKVKQAASGQKVNEFHLRFSREKRLCASARECFLRGPSANE